MSERFPTRAAKARQTRRRILDAAIRRFTEEGYPTTTVAAIAADAGVAVQTVYATFQTKRAVLAEAIDVAIAGDDEPIPVNERPWMLPVWQATDGPSTVRAYAAAVRLVQGRVAPLFRALDVAAAVEPELAELWEQTRQRRRLGAGGVTRVAAERTPLRPHLSVELATDLVWSLNSHDLYLNLVDGCGWTLAQYEAWLGDTLAEQLFD